MILRGGEFKNNLMVLGTSQKQMPVINDILGISLSDLMRDKIVFRSQELIENFKYNLAKEKRLPKQNTISKRNQKYLKLFKKHSIYTLNRSDTLSAKSKRKNSPKSTSNA